MMVAITVSDDGGPVKKRSKKESKEKVYGGNIAVYRMYPITQSEQ